MNYLQRIYRNLFLIILLSGSASMVSMAQKPAYRLFREDGKRARYEKMLEAASGADIVLFGEYHTNPISHWLQLELTNDLYKAKGESLIIGAEMFEADNQLIMDEYLGGKITETQFEGEARLWNNYLTDYKPLVLIAKDNGLKFVATNIPRRYANMVFKQGVASLDDLSPEAKSYIAPLPLEYDKSLNCYRQLIESAAPAGDSSATSPMAMAGPMGGHNSINLVDAQAIKDATMSYFIMKSWKPGKLFIHYNGAYHSDDFESIYWFLKQADEDLNIVTISTVSQETIDKLEDENVGKASFIIAVPSNMTQTNR